MGCPSSCPLGQNLVFSVCCHDPDTGVLTDASAVTYRIYADEGAQVWPAAGAAGTMAVLDTANTTGFYTELVAVTAANGFAHGVNYTVYIEATVDGIKGGIAFTFKVDQTALRTAVLAIGNVTHAQEAVEEFDYEGVHADVGVDNKGNRVVSFS